MTYDFHGVTVETHSPDALVAERWQATFASRPLTERAPDLRFSLELAEAVPDRPDFEPQFRQGLLLEYYLRGPLVVAHFPRFGQLQLNLTTGEIAGRILPAALAAQGVFEDLVAIGLSPLLRRRGMFLLHAFAAATSPTSNPPPPTPNPSSLTPGPAAALLVGDIGAGKTTTGLALLRAGWRLLSNDSPILKDEGEVQALAYPGLLSAHADTLRRFPELHSLLAERGAAEGERQKKSFAAEEFYPGVWADRAPARALLFPQVEARADHALEPLAAPEALRRLLPNAIEQWDREMIPGHLALLRRLSEQAPAFRLRLGPDSHTLPAAILSALQATQ
jgi:hypothetical protein